MVKRIFIAVVFFVIVFQTALAENYPVGARAVGLSQAVVALSDTWSTFHNQAGLTATDNYSFGIFYESRYRVDKLSLVAGSAILPTQLGHFGISFFQFGKENFKESKIGLAYAKKLAQSLSAGVQLDYFFKRFPENPTAKSFITFEVGLLYDISRKITLGMHVFNPIVNGFSKEWTNEQSAANFRLGGVYRVTKETLVLFEMEKDTRYPIRYKSAIEFSPLNRLSLRFGVSAKPFKYTLGVGYKIKSFSADIGFSYHRHLGVTPSISVQYYIP